MSNMEAVGALKRGGPVTVQKLVELRAKGMHQIRFAFIVRLLRLNIQTITLSIYWEDGREIMQAPTVENVQRKLVYASAPRISGYFDDMSLVCYSYDPDAKAKVDAELERMVKYIGEYPRKVSSH